MVYFLLLVEIVFLRVRMIGIVKRVMFADYLVRKKNVWRWDVLKLAKATATAPTVKMVKLLVLKGNAANPNK